jgi:hypothetical protein
MAHPIAHPRRSLAAALLAIALLAVPVGSPSAATDAGAPPARVPAPRVPAGKLGIGDSVMLGARTQLRAHGIRVDAVVSRQYAAGADLIASMAASGTLPRTVIVHLGNNGYLQRADCDRIARAAGPSRHVFLVSLKVPRGWRAANNQRLRACARAHDNAQLIGWYEASATHPGWFAADGYHLTSSGARAYAGLIAHHL